MLKFVYAVISFKFLVILDWIDDFDLICEYQK